MMMDVQVACRKCGKKAPSSEFTIDMDLKMAICKTCANEKKIAKSTSGFNPSVRNLPHEIPKSTAPKAPVSNLPGARQSPLGLNVERPAGWDETDELLEKQAAAKASLKSPDGNARMADGRVMHACSKCKYQFKYDPADDRPNKCPYCGTPTKGLFRQ